MKLYSIFLLLTAMVLFDQTTLPVRGTKLIKKLLKAKFLLKGGFGGKRGGGGNPAMVHFVIPLMPPLSGLLGGGNNGGNSGNSNRGNNKQNSGSKGGSGGLGLFNLGNRQGNSFLFPFSNFLHQDDRNDNREDCQQQQQAQLMHMLQHQQLQQQQLQQHQMFLPPRPQHQFMPVFTPIEQQTLESAPIPHHHRNNNNRHRPDSIKGRSQTDEEHLTSGTKEIKLVNKANKAENGWMDPVIIMMDIDHHHGNYPHHHVKKAHQVQRPADESKALETIEEEPGHESQPAAQPEMNSYYQSEMDSEMIRNELGDRNEPFRQIPSPQPFLPSDGLKM